MGRFDYVKYDEHAIAMQGALKTKFEEVETLCNYLVDGRAKSLAFTKLEEAYMWAGKALRDMQIVRDGESK